MLGAVTARGPAQVRRLAVIYALLDPKPDGGAIVSVAHLRAALEVWRYCEESAAYIFGDKLGDPTADTILAELRRAGFEGRTRNEMRDLFGRHRTAADLDRALASLGAAGAIRQETESTGGRPRTRYFCAESVKSAESHPKQGLTALKALNAQGEGAGNGEVEARG
jgi:hypothetical protein